MWTAALVLQAQLSPPSNSGADAATVGCWETATMAADFVPAGMFTAHLSAAITTTYPGGEYAFGPGRSLVVFAQRSKNLMMNETGLLCGAEK